MHPAHLTQETMRSAVPIADRACIADIETECARHTDGAGRIWWDIRPLTSQHEHSPEVIDMNTQGLAYAQHRGLTQPHPTHAHFVRIVRRP